VSGLIAAVPPLVGATAQLFAPALAARVKSPSRWIRGCALLQALSFVPMIVGAIVGWLPMWVLFLVAGVYWTSALGAGGVWNTWIGLCFPAKIRPRYFGIRSRLCQGCILAGLFAAAALLQPTHGTRWELWGFAGLFTIAGLARASSIPYLRRQRDPSEWPAHTHVSLLHFARNFWHRADARLVTLMLVMQVAVQMGQPFLNPFLIKQLKVSPLLYLGLIAASFAAKRRAVLRRRHASAGGKAVGMLRQHMHAAIWLAWPMHAHVSTYAVVAVVAAAAAAAATTWATTASWTSLRFWRARTAWAAASSASSPCATATSCARCAA
jgi:hypothetical protein